jgi:hypothetical protein
MLSRAFSLSLRGDQLASFTFLSLPFDFLSLSLGCFPSMFGKSLPQP